MIHDKNNNPIGGNVNLDVPVIHETLYDYDDMDGVVDDTDMGFEPMEYTITEILGGKCIVCGIRDKILLKIQSIRSYEHDSPKMVRRLVEQMIREGGNPRNDFFVLCFNHAILMNKIKKYRNSVGLRNLTGEELKQELHVKVF